MALCRLVVPRCPCKGQRIPDNTRETPFLDLCQLYPLRLVNPVHLVAPKVGGEIRRPFMISRPIGHLAASSGS